MPISIARSRQQLSALIVAAQQQPQVITRHNMPVAVLVSADYFQRSEAVVTREADTFYKHLQQLRETFVPQDDTGLARSTPTARQADWQRANAFGDSV